MHRTGGQRVQWPAQGNAIRPTVFAHGFRMASKASSLVEAGLTGADLTGCRIYGVSAQCLKLEGAKQQYLVVTSYGEPEITVDNIEGRAVRLSPAAQREDSRRHRYHQKERRAPVGPSMSPGRAHPAPRSAPPCPGGERSVGLLSGFEESAKGFEFGDAS